MISFQLKQIVGLSVTTALSLGCLVSSASAQFRDLDSETRPSPVKQSEPATDSLLDLVPIDAEFGSPSSGGSSETSKAPSTLVQPKPTAKPQPVQPEPTPQPELRPIPKPEPEPAKKPTSIIKSVKKADSVPKPEPASVESGTSTAAKARSMNSFLDQSTATNTETIEEGVYATKFNNVQAGSTTASELVELWGKPAKSIRHADGSKTLVYKIPSFRQVNVTVEDQLVSTILVQLSESLSVATIEKELGLEGIQAVPIPDDYGEVLGQSYPERGLMLSFTEETDSDLVSAILAEPISAEMFRLRAQYDFDHQYKRSLSDLSQAIQIDPKDAESYWLQAEYLDAIGKTRSALKSVQKAIRFRPTNPMYRMTRARLYAKTNRLQSGISEVKSVIDEIDLPNELAGRAHLLLGDLLAIGPEADHQEALKHHLKAIDFASKPVEDRRFAVRRMAKHVLVSAHMSVARDIAMGNFQRQTEVVPKWLLRATEMADEFISDDKGDELLQMLIFRDTLASYAELQVGTFDAGVATEEAIRAGKKIIASATDDHFKMHVERVLAETLLHTAKISRSRGKYEMALQHANNALALIENTSKHWEDMGHDKYLEAQLYFVIGSVHAIHESEHDEAVKWYAKARSTFVASNFASPLYSARGHGEMYVSMGLSFWENGDREKAIQLTQTGAELMKEAVETGSLQLKAMSVPYGNLATMHGKLGAADKSKEYAKLVAKVEQLGVKRR